MLLLVDETLSQEPQMLKVNRFDKFTCQVLRNELNAVLNKFGADVNLSFAVGNMKFTDTGVEIKVSGNVIGAKTIADSRLQSVARSHNFTLDPINGRQLVGYAPRSYKYPFIYLNLRDGKRYKCSALSAAAYFQVVKSAATAPVA
jgi:uncharacterized protein YejL (UPF0352 family)